MHEVLNYGFLGDPRRLGARGGRAFTAAFIGQLTVLMYLSSRALKLLIFMALMTLSGKRFQYGTILLQKNCSLVVLLVACLVRRRLCPRVFTHSELSEAAGRVGVSYLTVLSQLAILKYSIRSPLILLVARVVMPSALSRDS